MSISQGRRAVLERIEEYERLGYFDRDVEDDPPTVPLDYERVDFAYEKLSSRIGAWVANKVGKGYFERCIRRGLYVMRPVEGAENFLSVKDRGTLIVCNHFNAFDNYAVNRVLAPMMPGRDLYKIIREGNYTSFGGFFGYLFRHCNTLPLCGSVHGMKRMMDGLSKLFRRGEKVLIYPEQGMWYNYRKPRPLKVGAFRFAAKEMAPVLPIFITLADTDRLDPDGLPVQAYTVHIHPALEPDPERSVRENARWMCEQTYELWKKTYERVYGIPLTYTTEGEVLACSM